MYDPPARRAALELLAAGATLSQVSRATGIQRSSLRQWLVAEDPLATACWRCAGAAPAAPERYAALLGFYLGDGCISTHRAHTTLRISCDAAFPGIIQEVSQAMATVRGPGGVFQVRAPGAVVVSSNWKHWPCVFPQHGPGRKHERRIVLADWQRDVVAAHPGDFLRGLFHSDGCRVANWTSRVVRGERRRYDYPRWQFSNRSADIRDLCGWALDLAGVSWRPSGPWMVSVSRREAVVRLDALIGPKA